MLQIIPITSKLKNNLPVHVNLYKNAGLPKESTLLAEQILTIDKKQIYSNKIVSADEVTLKG